MSTPIGGLSRVRAAIFDFNGTITDDEELQYEIFSEVFRENLGIVLDRRTYFAELAGMSDPGIIGRMLHICGCAADAGLRRRLGEQRLRAYLERVASSPPVRPGAVRLVSRLAERIPLAVATGAFREEVEFVLTACGLLGCFTTVVTIEDVARGKPDPECFQEALSRLNAAQRYASEVQPHEVVVFEDSSFGVSAARAAGMPCVAAHVITNHTDAELTVGSLDIDLVGE